MKTFALISWLAFTRTKPPGLGGISSYLALGCFCLHTAGMKVLANGLNNAFSEIGAWSTLTLRRFHERLEASTKLAKEPRSGPFTE